MLKVLIKLFKSETILRISFCAECFQQTLTPRRFLQQHILQSKKKYTVHPLLFLDHGTRRGEGSASRPGRSLPPGKDPVPIVQEAGWGLGLVCTSAENLAPTRIRSPDRPARSSVAIPTELPGPYLIECSFHIFFQSISFDT